MGLGAFHDLHSDTKSVYPRRKPENIAAAEGIEGQEVSGDRGTPDPEMVSKRAKQATYAANHPKRGKK